MVFIFHTSTRCLTLSEGHVKGGGLVGRGEWLVCEKTTAHICLSVYGPGDGSGTCQNAIVLIFTSQGKVVSMRCWWIITSEKIKTVLSTEGFNLMSSQQQVGMELRVTVVHWIKYGQEPRMTQSHSNSHWISQIFITVKLSSQVSFF